MKLSVLQQHISVKAGTMGILADMGVEMRVTKYTRVGFGVKALFPQGLYCLRRAVYKDDAFTGALKLKLRLLRAAHAIETEFLLCDSVDYLPAASLYGLFVPAVACMLCTLSLLSVSDKNYSASGIQSIRAILATLHAFVERWRTGATT